MFRPDPRTLPATPAAHFAAPDLDESELWSADDGDRDGDTLLRLLGAATLAVLALAVASLVLV